MRSWFLGVCLSKTSKPGMICETRGRVWEGGHPGVKTEDFLQIFKIQENFGKKENFGKSGKNMYALLLQICFWNILFCLQL